LEYPIGRETYNNLRRRSGMHFEMTKTRNMFVVGLLVLFFSAAGIAFAAGPTPLKGTTWAGDMISVTTAGVVKSPPNVFSISFQTESDDLGLLSGTFTDVAKPSGVSFSAVRDGHTLSIVAVGYIINAEIIRGKILTGEASKVTKLTPTLLIKGKSLTDGSQFEAILTQK